jgi:alpha-tubulin suppressor-like RCC1 family protein
VARVTGGYYHSCALLTNGQARCWGETDNGELGDGTPYAGPDRNRPRTVLAPTGTGPLTGIVAIDANQGTTCAIVGGGQVRCWGEGDTGQLGNGQLSDRNRPVPVKI